MPTRTQELLFRDRGSCQGEGSTDLFLMLHFVVTPAGLRNRRSHHKLHGPWNDHHRLTLTVDVPLWWRLPFLLLDKLLDALQTLVPLLLVLCPFPIHLLQPRFLLPLPQQPFRRCVKTGIGLGAILGLQLLQQSVSGIGR
jgi:hypothetical protein